jgi:squalene-hopene/tetraprenyl-beta-curcumene cyclase
MLRQCRGEADMSASELLQDRAHAGRVDEAIARATSALLALQCPGGFWQGVVHGAANLEAEYVFLHRLLGRQRPEQDRRMADRLLATQQLDGGWSLAPGLPSHLSTTIEAYLALRLAGLGTDEPALVRARDVILAGGGLAGAGMFTRFWLACFGQFPWAGVPRVPVEMVLLPTWAPLNIYRLSSSTRATLVPFALLMVHRPEVRVPPEADVRELWLREPTPRDLSFARSPSVLSWRNVFLALDRSIALLGRVRWKPMRRRAVARAIEWVLRHEDATGQWAGIQPAMVQSVLALHAIGFAADHPAIVRGVQGLDDLLAQRGTHLVYQPCVMTTLDTVQAVRALLDAGTAASHPALERAADWLVARQSFRPGDWIVHSPELDAGGWAAELANDFYPRTDVSALAVSVLGDLPIAGTAAGRRALAHGLEWTLGMQGRDGGWAAFDCDNASRFLDAVPFPDLEGVTEPASADVTGQVLAAAAGRGFGLGLGRVRRGAEYLRRTQHGDGSWSGRWGVNALYGTWLAVTGLLAAGEDPRAAHLQRAVAWLEARQNADGGWGESPVSYEDAAHRGIGESTPSQTAWAVMALLAAAGPGRPAVSRGVEYLLGTQTADGAWNETAFTATAVPRRAYVRRELSPLLAALRALGHYRARVEPAA